MEGRWVGEADTEELKAIQGDKGTERSISGEQQ